MTLATINPVMMTISHHNKLVYDFLGKCYKFSFYNQINHKYGISPAYDKTNYKLYSLEVFLC